MQSRRDGLVAAMRLDRRDLRQRARARQPYLHQALAVVLNGLTEINR